MSFFSNWFGAKYDDQQLVAQATKAIAADPLISDPTSLVVTSKKGVITLGGIVLKEQEKNRIADVVRNALTNAGLKHERLINELKLAHR
jgi:osmotically-inducible protein OsmY